MRTIIGILLFFFISFSASSQSKKGKSQIKGHVIHGIPQLISESERIRREQEMRLEPLYPVDLSYKFRPKLWQDEIDKLLMNGDSFIKMRIREKYVENCKAEFIDNVTKVYFVAIAISFLVAYFTRKKTLQRFFITQLILLVLMYLSSATLGLNCKSSA